MILYIAGPMSGIKDQNYPAFNDAERALWALGYLTRNPVTVERYNDTGKPQTWDWYMRQGIRLLLEADGVCLLPGWENSKGATLERTIALAIGMPVKTYAEWLREGE